VTGDWWEIRESPHAAAPSRSKIGMLGNADAGNEGGETVQGFLKENIAGAGFRACPLPPPGNHAKT